MTIAAILLASASGLVALVLLLAIVRCLDSRRYASLVGRIDILSTERAHLALLLRERMTDADWAKLPAHIQAIVTEELDRLVSANESGPVIRVPKH